jgi:hypothetical protein
VKGQKIIYMESKYHVELQLNLLMMPAMFLSAAAAVLTQIIDIYTWGPMLLASMSAFITFLLGLINYFKLELHVWHMILFIRKSIHF